jgi:hypothetical protein
MDADCDRLCVLCIPVLWNGARSRTAWVRGRLVRIRGTLGGAGVSSA